jgi:hypothetical protein
MDYIDTSRLILIPPLERRDALLMVVHRYKKNAKKMSHP